MRTEGHPALWHLCLYAIARVSRNPLSMQLFHAMVATASIYLLATFSPFTQAQKVLASFGYFSFYEYAIVSRGYVLGVFLVFLFCSLYPRHQKQQNSPEPKRVWFFSLLPFIILSFLANTSIYGLFLSVALCVALIWPQPRKNWLQTWVGVGILGLAWLICYLQVSRIHVFSYTSPGIISNELTDNRVSNLLNLGNRLMEVISHIWRSYVPLPPFWRNHFWSNNALADLYALPFGLNLLLPFLLSILLLALVLKSFRHQPKWLAVYSIGTATMLLFGYFIFPGYLRHHGHLYILLLVCFWLCSTDAFGASLSESSDKSFCGRSRRFQKQLFTVILIGQMLSGTIAYAADIAQSFSGSQKAADFLRSQNLTHLAIFGYSFDEVSTLAGYLDKPIYYPEQGGFGTFWRSTKDFTPAQIWAEIPAFVDEQQQPVIVVLNVPLETTIPGISLEPLTYASSQMVGGESLHLYMATPTDVR